MKLHTDIELFTQSIRSASQYLGINEIFIEKDYWITLALSCLAKSKFVNETVFKGGTSLSKGFGLIDRFSEDVDIAIIDDNNMSGNQIKTIIRTVEKEMTADLKEIKVLGVTSKGSRFRKSVFQYVSIDPKNPDNKLMVEVNSFANPIPYTRQIITSLVFDFFTRSGNANYINQYDLQPFFLNVLNKEQTLMEKLGSLIRFSYENNVTESISKKIRHFYDLYFLMNDKACAAFINSGKFKQLFEAILEHDKDLFDEPAGWKEKLIGDSPLVNDFKSHWLKLKSTYQTELSAYAYSPIPDERQVAEAFQKLIKRIL